MVYNMKVIFVNKKWKIKGVFILRKLFLFLENFFEKIREEKIYLILKFF